VTGCIPVLSNNASTPTLHPAGLNRQAEDNTIIVDWLALSCPVVRCCVHAALFADHVPYPAGLAKKPS
jgi:hypothetical protein